MPSQVRFIQARNSAQWDELVRQVLNGNRLGVEHDYFGIVNEDRADRVRRCIRTAAKHLGAGCKAYWKPCPAPGACPHGGPDCKYHVYYTIYDMDAARKYKAEQAKATSS